MRGEKFYLKHRLQYFPEASFPPGKLNSGEDFRAGMGKILWKTCSDLHFFVGIDTEDGGVQVEGAGNERYI